MKTLLPILFSCLLFAACGSGSDSPSAEPAAAMLGYTGAVFTRFFGSAFGLILASGALFLWTALPACSALRLFRRQDF